eukprot:jgi/Mesvir1/23529/Mv18230-RA.1
MAQSATLFRQLAAQVGLRSAGIGFWESWAREGLVPASRRTAFHLENKRASRTLSSGSQVNNRAPQRSATLPVCRPGAAQRRLSHAAPSGTGSTEGGSSPPTPSVGRLNHIAIAVPDVRAASDRLRKVLGVDIGEPLALPEHGVTAAFVHLPNTTLELMEPLGDASPIASFLKKNPAGGLHHICLEVGALVTQRCERPHHVWLCSTEVLFVLVYYKQSQADVAGPAWRVLLSFIILACCGAVDGHRSRPHVPASQRACQAKKIHLLWLNLYSVWCKRVFLGVAGPSLAHMALRDIHEAIDARDRGGCT